jgi:hypothetical protein
MGDRPQYGDRPGTAVRWAPAGVPSRHFFPALLLGLVFLVLCLEPPSAEAVPSVTYKCNPLPQDCSGWFRSNVSVDWTVLPTDSVVDGCIGDVHRRHPPRGDTGVLPRGRRHCAGEGGVPHQAGQDRTGRSPRAWRSRRRVLMCLSPGPPPRPQSGRSHLASRASSVPSGAASSVADTRPCCAGPLYAARPTTTSSCHGSGARC